MNRVDNRCLLMLARERRLELQDAARVASGDDIGLERRNEVCFAIAESVGRFRLNEIVNPRGATADGRFGNLREFEPRNAAEQNAWLRAHTLGMLQVAGIVKRHA